MRVRLTFYYEANPNDYDGETDPHEMARIDRQSIIDQGPMIISELIEDLEDADLDIRPAPDDEQS